MKVELIRDEINRTTVEWFDSRAAKGVYAVIIALSALYFAVRVFQGLFQ